MDCRSLRERVGTPANAPCADRLQSLDIPDLPRIDVVMVSHNHYDHLDRGSVLRLAAMPSVSPLFLVPLGVKAWFNQQGITRVEEYDWWQSRTDGPLRMTLVPVQHWSRRTLTDANRTLWGGWVLEGGGLRIIHTGDLGYSRAARDIGEQLGPFDLAFISAATRRAGSCRPCMWTCRRLCRCVRICEQSGPSACIGAPSKT
jgi:L-ascorbate metabolism protein UlaG (beta-lactamase superfamily)